MFGTVENALWILIKRPNDNVPKCDQSCELYFCPGQQTSRRKTTLTDLT